MEAKDLRVSYVDENSQQQLREYDTIMDFLDEMESDRFSASNIVADFFQNPLMQKKFDSLDELYQHCSEIVK